LKQAVHHHQRGHTTAENLSYRSRPKGLGTRIWLGVEVRDERTELIAGRFLGSRSGFERQVVRRMTLPWILARPRFTTWGS